MIYKFGSEIKSNTYYSKESGYGFLEPKCISIKDGNDYIYANNYRSSDEIPVYEYPTFIVDLPNGVYAVTITQTTNGVEDAVNGAIVNNNYYAVRWSNQYLSTTYDEPTSDSYVYTKAGEKRISNIQVAVSNGQIKFEFTSFITNSGASGITYVESLEITQLPKANKPCIHPTLRFIGDSTVANYPPNESPQWASIPERTGWGERFCFERFTDGNILLINHSVAGSSLKSFVYEGYFNNFLIESKPGDTVVIEAGINDIPSGRRFADLEEFASNIQYQIDACNSFGIKVILCSATCSLIEYNNVIRRVAKDNNIPFIDLMNLWSDYLSKVEKSSHYVTVDGCHLRRTGGIIAARLVSNAIATLDYPISKHILAAPVNYEMPTCTVSNPRIISQAKKSVTICWDIDDETLYDPNQLITYFNIYEVSPRGRELIYSSSAYISAGGEHPVLKATLPILGGTNAYLSITCEGPTGEGPFSELVKIKSYEPSMFENLQLMIRDLETPLYDSTVYTEDSFNNLKEVLTVAKNATSRDNCSELYLSLLEAKSNLQPIATCIEKTDFSFERPGFPPSDLTGCHKNLSTIMLEENGNRLLRFYVEAAGSRYISRPFNSALSLNAKTIIINFTWYPGLPDQRNVTELEFFSSEQNRVISLKTSSNGHIGYVVGNYSKTDNRYMVGDGFHPYPDSKAVDLGLTNKAWYTVRLQFNFDTQTVDLRLNDTIVNNIPVDTDCSNTITKLNFLMERGKNDNGVSNDLSILWETFIDNFAMFYI